MESLILVDRNDRQVGIGEKLQTHREGRLHRAFSIFVFDSAGRLLLQQRAPFKYHSASLWSNTCCGHPRPGESTEAAARRRLQEEMSITCDLRKVSAFVYRKRLTPHLTEHEYDHVLVGRFDGSPLPAALEVAAWRWVEVGDLRRELRDHPGRYTCWLKPALDRVPLPKLRPPDS